MRDKVSGWEWFSNTAAEAKSSREVPPHGDPLSKLFARTFQSRSGERVLAHLKSMTLDRSHGPEATDAILRHQEGQRQLVSYILSLVERGSGRPLVTGSACEPATEKDND